MSQLGEVIRRLRNSKEMSQAEFGLEIGRSASHISHVETGKHNSSLTIEELQLVADLTNFTLTDILFFSGYLKAGNKEVAESKIAEMKLNDLLSKAKPIYHGKDMQGYFISTADFQSSLSIKGESKVTNIDSFLKHKNLS